MATLLRSDRYPSTGSVAVSTSVSAAPGLFVFDTEKTPPFKEAKIKRVFGVRYRGGMD